MRLTYLLVAILYGAAWPTALANTVLVALRLAAGEAPGSALPFALLGWAIILHVHHRRGWPPFSTHPSRLDGC
ncbi:MAG: hypothetical protein IRZ14_09950 [Chloroflexi bacterium]|nr:hypothetical protein [Chloroflexota bacterium]